MTVRLRLVLVILATGIATALAVVAAVAMALQRFEQERTYDRANAFVERVVANYDDLLEQQARDPASFVPFLRSLLLYEPTSQLYLLAGDGTVLASSGHAPLRPGFKVALAPVQQAAAVGAGGPRMPYVMGDDPETMARDAVIAARALQRATIAPGPAAAGYLYLVCQSEKLSLGPAAWVRSTVGGPAMLWLLALIACLTLLAAWIVATVTRPLRVLSDEVATAAREGFNAVSMAQAPRRASDEFGRLHEGFRQLLATLRAQWTRLAEVDRFRREGVSNLSHDLRSPLTATAACLETLQRRWGDEAARSDDRQLVDIALRNTRNAAALVRALGDLALLDEPAFKLAPMLVDVDELLDDIARRFAGRAGQQGVTLACEPAGEVAPFARVDIELFERALANLLDNALKFTPAGGRITLAAQVRDGRVCVAVSDSGTGIAAADLPHLFDRLYRARSDDAPAGSEGGKGLGLAIVRRIVELHGGEIDVASRPGQGTVVRILLPPA